MKTFALLFIVLLAGCSIEPMGTRSTNNSKAKVEVLFTDENGYTVHKFYDAGEYHYYVTPQGSVSSTHNAGRTTYQETIHTVHP